MIENWYWKNILEVSDEILNTYSCIEEPRVEEYFKKFAKENDKYLFTKTKVLLNQKDQIIGYFSLYNEVVEIGRKKAKSLKWSIMEDSYNTFPAVRLHYLGLNDNFRGRGFGDYLLGEVFRDVVDVTDRTGCMFITAEAINDRAVKFNESSGFQMLIKSPLKSIPHKMAFKVSDLL